MFSASLYWFNTNVYFIKCKNFKKLVLFIHLSYFKQRSFLYITIINHGLYIYRTQKGHFICFPISHVYSVPSVSSYWSKKFKVLRVLVADWPAESPVNDVQLSHCSPPDGKDNGGIARLNVLSTVTTLRRVRASRHLVDPRRYSPLCVHWGFCKNPRSSSLNFS